MAGLKDVLGNLNREIGKITGRTPQGVLAAATFVKGESQEITPQRKGVLINSALALITRFGSNPVASAGYTARYAPAVHEMPDTNNFTKPGTGPKFLQKAAFNNTKTILKIIRARVKL